MSEQTSKCNSHAGYLISRGIYFLVVATLAILAPVTVHADEGKLDFVCRTTCDLNFEREITAYAQQLGVVNSLGRKIIVDYSRDSAENFLNVLLSHYPKRQFKYTFIYSNRWDEHTYKCDMVARLDNQSKSEVIYQVKYDIKPSIGFSKKHEAYTECLKYVALNFTYKKEKASESASASVPITEPSVSFDCETVCDKRFQEELYSYIRKLGVLDLPKRKVVISYLVDAPGSLFSLSFYPREEFRYTYIYIRASGGAYGCRRVIRYDNLYEDEVIYEVEYGIKPTSYFDASNEDYTECLNYLKLSLEYHE